jgi:hypothetical protein
MHELWTRDWYKSARRTRLHKKTAVVHPLHSSPPPVTIHAEGNRGKIALNTPNRSLKPPRFASTPLDKRP